MKTLNDFVTKQYISLKGLDDNIIENIKNLEDMQISECCCCGCGDKCDTKCCDPSDPYLNNPDNENFYLKFYSEKQIINKLKSDLKVQDIFDLYSQFIRGRFYMKQIETPLIFNERLFMSDGELIEGRSYLGNNALLNLILKTELNNSIILIRLDGSIQIFGLMFTGTNGSEGTIKSSLIKASKKLTYLENLEEVKWSQVLDVSIDNSDDVYTFLITYTVDQNLIPDNPHDENKPQPINKIK